MKKLFALLLIPLVLVSSVTCCCFFEQVGHQDIVVSHQAQEDSCCASKEPKAKDASSPKKCKCEKLAKQTVDETQNFTSKSSIHPIWPIVEWLEPIEYKKIQVVTVSETISSWIYTPLLYASPPLFLKFSIYLI